ncbi:hypothetical protein DEO72_LG10g2577 [Vigna unguiculata]|uniref:Uncharacterized protein n=1 Tax=Vigna unguiculata TaxID=3917 RepID=A0A4D6NF42_VIGUN|nr:hypothetical protein DEO72_LG10g2577 [Vigna unguiculata]
MCLVVSHDIVGPHDGRGWMRPLKATLGEEVHSMVIACVSWSEQVKVQMVGLRTREFVGQDYKRDRLVGWTTSEEVRGSTTSLETKMHLHTTYKGDDQITCYPEADDDAGEPVDA